MLVTTSPVTVLLRETYSPVDQDPNDSRERIVWPKSMGEHEGKLIEKLQVFDPAGASVWDNLTLHPDATKDAKVDKALAAMAVVRLTCEVKREAKPANSRSGREYVAVKDKWRVVGVEIIAPGQSVSTSSNGQRADAVAA